MAEFQAGSTWKVQSYKSISTWVFTIADYYNYLIRGGFIEFCNQYGTRSFFTMRLEEQAGEIIIQPDSFLSFVRNL